MKKTSDYFEIVQDEQLDNNKNNFSINELKGADLMNALYTIYEWYKKWETKLNKISDKIEDGQYHLKTILTSKIKISWQVENIKLSFNTYEWMLENRIDDKDIILKILQNLDKWFNPTIFDKYKNKLKWIIGLI